MKPSRDQGFRHHPVPAELIFKDFSASSIRPVGKGGANKLPERGLTEAVRYSEPNPRLNLKIQLRAAINRDNAVPRTFDNRGLPAKSDSENESVKCYTSRKCISLKRT